MSEKEQLIQRIVQAVTDHPERLSTLLQWMGENKGEDV
jgi:hypothetical protein